MKLNYYPHARRYCTYCVVCTYKLIDYDLKLIIVMINNLPLRLNHHYTYVGRF